MGTETMKRFSEKFKKEGSSDSVMTRAINRYSLPLRAARFRCGHHRKAIEN